MSTRNLPTIPNSKSAAFEIHVHKSKEQEAKERENRRETATQELINSETQYNILLALLIKHYVEPLKDYKTMGILTNDQHTKLFPQLQSIKELSDNFLAALQQRRRNWDSNTTKLSDLFDTFNPYFRMYQDHVNNRADTVELLKELNQKTKWVIHCQKVEQYCQRIPLSDLLKLPTEQLVKYDTTLSEILMNTTPTHPDYNNLTKSYEAFNQTVELINLKMIDYDRRENVRKIERKFKDDVKLLEPHRSFICEGKLWKISARTTKDRLYHFFLFNDLLIYTSPYGQKYKIHNMLPINDKFRVQMYNDAKKYGAEKNGRIFSIKSETKSFVVYADTVNLAVEWVKQLKQCETNQNRPERRSSRVAKKLAVPRHVKHMSAETLPVWVPDSHAKQCKTCTVKFTVTKRRHHCRKCGAVVCGKCSKYKTMNNDGVKQRACKTCYYALNSAYMSPVEPNFSGSFPTMTISTTIESSPDNSWMFQLDAADD
eukprot:68241_1